MNASTLAWAEKVGKELCLGGPALVRRDVEGAVLTLPCALGHAVDFVAGRKLPPEVIKKKLRQKKWHIGSRLICPLHNTEKRNLKNVVRALVDPLEKMIMPGDVTPIAAVQPVDASDQARTAKRFTIMALEESFNDGRYKPGVSDASIAKETGLSEPKVAEYREEFFGPIREPEGIEQARAELDAFARRVDDLEKRNAETIEKLRQDVAAHRQRLGSLISKNGWKQH